MEVLLSTFLDLSLVRGKGFKLSVFYGDCNIYIYMTHIDKKLDMQLLDVCIDAIFNLFTYTINV